MAKSKHRDEEIDKEEELQENKEEELQDGMDFGSLKLIQLTVTVDAKKYILREADGDAACNFKNSMASGTKFANGKLSGIGKVADAEYVLLDTCLQTLNGQHLGVVQLRKWPERVLKKMIDWVRKTSELNPEDGEDKEGKSENE